MLANAFDLLLKESLRAENNLFFEKISTSPLKAYLIAKIYNESGKNILIITGEGVEETRLKDDITFFTKKEVFALPPLDISSEQLFSSKESVGVRQKTLKAIVDHLEPIIVISSLQATLERVPSKKSIDHSEFVLRVGEKKSFDAVLKAIQQFGYERAPITVSKGEFSIRGGIIDLFSVTASAPFRIEFFGDEIDSIRLFDPTSQKAFEERPQVEIIYAKEAQESLHASIFDLMGKKETLLILDDIEKVEDRYVDLSGYNALLQEAPRAMDRAGWLSSIQAMSSWCMVSEKGLESLAQDIRYDKKSSFGRIEPEPLSFSLFDTTWHGVRLSPPLESLQTFYMTECLYDTPPHGETLLDAYTQSSASHTFIVQSEVEKEWIQTKLKERGVSLEKAHVVHGYLSSGLARRDTRECFLPMSELTGRARRVDEDSVRRDRSRTATGFDAYDLEPSDYVVHFHHGIGKFLGIEKRVNAQGVEQEFFLIEYAENAKLYVPLHHAHLVTKYVGAKDERPRFHTLGASRWKKLREDTEKAIVGYASELLKTHATREIAGGVQFPQDGPKTILFEAEFPFQETEDQMSAIEEIKRDMCSEKAMDRLVCGDVGYGKTEVAMRAAFKAVSDGGKQVAVLVPTTVLAIQHYENFLERMTPFGIRVALFSRFQTAKQNRELVDKAACGEIDIVIGTHKLLQKGLSFSNLGLVIIDEEQRFGVRAKEHLKIMKSGVDCLTLSATPIPRTLYMSLIGAKDLSTIATPPYNRLPIKTVVMEYDEDTVQVAVLREMNRGGQVFYIHNRVETIGDACTKLQKLVPRARVTAVHGQMHSDDIDLIFHAFKKGDIDVLVATSIIENGIDMPNANTMIVERADQFGVADLYQLRGRVGRSNRHAFAYFLIPQRGALSDVCRRRMQAIAQAGGYGGGLKVAMRDLEIRGAGDILGVEQSGHVASIGFHLYCKLLKRTVDSLRGKRVNAVYDTKIEVSQLACIPDWYINEVALRVEIYQRLGEVDALEEVDTIRQEMVDRFGPLPVEADWLIAISKVRCLAASKGITLIKVESHSVRLEAKQGKEVRISHLLISKCATPEQFFDTMRAIVMQ